MKFNPATHRTLLAKRGRGAFTLAEVLAALAFMAIVIPVAIQGLRIANLAGQVGQRKAAAGRIAERVLNEWIIGSLRRKINGQADVCAEVHGSLCEEAHTAVAYIDRRAFGSFRAHQQMQRQA